MKTKQLLHAAAALLLLGTATGCQQEFFEENTPSQGAMREITIQASMGEPGGNTRASMTPDGSDITTSTWVSAWESTDKLGAWASGESSFSEFSIGTYDNDAKTASFTGTIPTSASQLRFVYPWDNTANAISTNSYTVDISSQQFDATAPFLHYGKNKPMVSDLMPVTDDNVGSVKLRNLCAGMEYKLAFSGMTTGQDVRVLYVEVEGINNKGTLDMANGTLTETAGAIRIDVSNSPQMTTSNFSVIGAVFPFKIAAATGVLTVKVMTNYGMVQITKTNTGSELDFGIGKHHNINLDVDMSTVAAFTEYWKDCAANSFDAGNGDSSSPYIIKTPEQFAKLINDVNGGNDYTDSYFELGNDIDLSGKQWTAIGTITETFSGRFDGKGYKVTGLYINKNVGLQGLFAFLIGATIKNLHVSGSVTTTRSQVVGGIVASLEEQSKIEGCSFSGVVSATYSSYGLYVGGIVGSSHSTSSITSCYNTGSVSASGSGSTYAGGILGKSEGGTVSYCYCLNAVDGGTNTVVGTGTATNSATLSDAQMKGTETFQYTGAGDNVYMIDELKKGDATYWQARPGNYPWLGF